MARRTRLPTLPAGSAQAEARARAQTIPDGLDLAARPAAGDGAFETRAVLGHGGVERSLGGRHNERTPRAIVREEGLGRGRRGRIQHGEGRAEAGHSRFGGEGGGVHAGGCRSDVRLRNLGYRNDKAVTGGDPGLMDGNFLRVHQIAAPLKR